MPIRESQRHLYPRDWKKISLLVKRNARWKCQGSPAFPRCRAQHGKPHPSTGSVVVLTTAHLDHNPANNDLSNLRAWCQRCHNTYDAPRRRINAKFTQERIAAERALRGLA